MISKVAMAITSSNSSKLAILILININQHAKVHMHKISKVGRAINLHNSIQRASVISIHVIGKKYWQ